MLSVEHGVSDVINNQLQPHLEHPEHTMTDLWQWFLDELYNKNDPRTEGWFLVSRPGSLAAILLLYLYFCLRSGPNYMAKKPPYSLRSTLIVYNLTQVLLSAYLVYESLMSGWLFEINWACQPIDFSDSPSALRLAKTVHFYFVCKIIELLDTVFFVLRKKDRQISFLHVFHHLIMPISTWVGVRYAAGGSLTLFGALNSFVHIIMYGYYMMSAWGLDEKKFLWWKQSLTALQIAQFLIVFVHSAQMLINGCDVPKQWLILILGFSLVFTYLFGSFYVENYITKKTRKSHSTLKSQ